jgi:hypothetical protein
MQVKLFYGMSSATAMMKHTGGVAEYRYKTVLACIYFSFHQQEGQNAFVNRQTTVTSC